MFTHPIPSHYMVVPTHTMDQYSLQSLLIILSCHIMDQDPQHGMTHELIDINIYGMFYKWVLLNGIYYIITSAHLSIHFKCSIRYHVGDRPTQPSR
jgi:hypothetical protein